MDSHMNPIRNRKDIPIIYALRTMEGMFEKFCPVEALDATYQTWTLICNYIERRELAKENGGKLGLYEQMDKIVAEDIPHLQEKNQ